MPVLRERKPKAKTVFQRAVDDELEQMLDRAGMGSRSVKAKAKRIKALLSRKQTLTRDAQDEQDALIIERRVGRRHDRLIGELATAARQRWAERSARDPDWVAKWEKRAEQSRRTYGSLIDAEGMHLVHAVSSSKAARRIARQTERGYDLVLKLEARRARRKDSAGQPPKVAQATPPPAPRAPSPPLDEPPAEVAERPKRRQRVKYGIVAQYSAYGERVY